MKKRKNNIKDILLRYSTLVIIGLVGINFFYFLFFSLTIYPVYFILKIFFNASLNLDIITINNLPSIKIIGACIAGSAYYLLLILNLAVPNIKLEKRIKLLLFSFASLLVINILRIFLLSIMFVQGISFFDLTHKLFWYVGSTLFVVAIWFIGVKIFHIKEIPFCSDIKFLWENLRKNTKNPKRSKKH